MINMKEKENNKNNKISEKTEYLDRENIDKKLKKERESLFSNIFINDEVILQKKIIFYKLLAVSTAIINLFFSNYFKSFLIVQAILISYLLFNLFLIFTIYSISFRKIEKYTIYIDTIIISIIITMRGGIRSDFYLGYILILQYLTLLPNKGSINLTIFYIILIYAISCILSEKTININWGRFIIRITFLIVSYFILSFIIKIIKSYNSIQYYAFNKLLRDSLTGVYNRNLFEELFSEQHVQSKTQVYILVDIDNMKEINDKYGHLAGDETLKTLGGIFLNNLRKSDICIRYGGDEFLIILNNISVYNCYKLMKRIIKIIENITLTIDNNNFNFSISCGISQIPEKITYKEAIKYVDEKLYKAKKEGKNKIIYN
ncbi:MAG: GGDEF domain-containing protein [Spirochaetes bacterium]|nr:GGDEF domain-containing protein [Spirochaetota bacterium]